MAASPSGAPAAGRTEVILPEPLPWPAVACSPTELERLRAAWQGTGRGHEVVAARVRAAEEALERPVAFPPEGGQHNQWYQCDACQIALETVDDTHHRCPSCDRVYSGYPYDQVVYSRRHHGLTRDLGACAWAWALTGDERFAARAREILVGYGERYATYPYHSASQGRREDPPSGTGGHVYEQTLDEAAWMGPVTAAYDLVRIAPALSAADHRTIREGLLLPVCETIARHRAGKSNWQTYHNSAFLLVGGVLGRADLVDQALNDPDNGFHYQMQVSVLPGGMWYENSWSYHFYTLGAMERILEGARRLGLDLYGEPGVKAMYTVALDYRMPDGTLPRLGDATTGGIPGGRYEAAYHRWPEPSLLAVLPEAPTWDSILYGRTASPAGGAAPATSALKPGAGHGILRATGPEGASAAVLTFGPFGGFHGHFDKLSFAYFALDRELGYDPGRARS
ncbi:MAG: alginate lyase family protein, partial [Gemmatimonadota bacterium]